MNENFYNDLALIKEDYEQFAAYKSMSNTVLIAGPGSGKTRVLSLKAVSLSKLYIHRPQGLACISFSRESVRELKSRLKKYGFIPNDKDFIGTVHSFSLIHVIQPFAHLFPEYNVTYPIKIIPYEVSNKLYERVLSDMGIDDYWQLPLTDINKHRSLALSGRSTVQIDATEQIIEGANLYEKYLRETEYLDFTSIINISATIIREQEFVRQALHSKFPWLLVDEYQDLGKALHEMVLELVFYAGIKLYAVGDVNQSIYGFNGGYPDFLQELTTNDDITPIYLQGNYRSSQHIIEASLETLQPAPPAPKYISQKLKNEKADFFFLTCEEDMDSQYKLVADKVISKLQNQGIPLNEIGVIVGSNNETVAMAQALKENNIPFFIARWNFENSSVLVWLQECAGWCIDMQEQSFDTLFRYWKNLLLSHNDVRARRDEIVNKILFYDVMKKAKLIVTTFEWLVFVIENLELKKTLLDSEIYPNEIRNLDKVIDEATLFNLKNTSIRRFANLGAPNNEVTITTRHSSKGLEFEAVIMLGMEEEHFPSYRHIGNNSAIAEDQRLCYVCVSRAKKSCILLRSEVYNILTKRGEIWRKKYKPSRFWKSLHSKFGNNDNTFTARSFR